jgi:hypothetical protein
MLKSLIVPLAVTCIIAYIIAYAYDNHYTPRDNIIIKDNSILEKFNQKVKSLQLQKIALWCNDLTPFTENLCHWWIIANLESEEQILLSSSATMNVFVEYPWNHLKKIRDYEEIPVLYPITLYELVSYASSVVSHYKYGFTTYNCHDIVTRILNKFTTVNISRPHYAPKKIIKEFSIWTDKSLINTSKPKAKVQ